jgi:putative ABC transport system permease protein
MLRLAARNLTSRKLRTLSTALAVFFGVAMIAGTLMLSDAVNRSFDDIFATVNEGIDVTVRAQTEVEDFGYSPNRGVREELLDDVRAIDGIVRAEGAIADAEVLAILDEEGDRVGPPQGGPPHIAASVLPEPFESLIPVEGTFPTSGDEVAIDSITAENEGFEVGGTVRITGARGAKDYTISGISQFGEGIPLGGASLAQFTLQEAQRITDKVGRYDEIDIEAAEGVEASELAATISAELPDNVEVRTGEETAEADAGTIQEGFGFLTTALLVFAGIAVFVGAFLIFNTFSITVAQRVREHAMLRTLGASSRQVLAAVLLEAALIGLLAAMAGIAGGYLFVQLLQALFEAMGFDLPTEGLRVTATALIVALVIGVGATMLSALVPALRATRVAPLEALRESGGAQLADRRRRRRGTIVAGAMVVVGVGLILAGLFVADGFGNALGWMGLGLVLVFIGMAMLGDRYVPFLARTIGWPIQRLRGVTGRLARENSQRHPGRTATTAAALMIGVALVVFVGVFAGSLQASVEETLDQQFAGDVAIVNQDGFSPIPSRVAEEVAEIDGVGAVAPLISIPARVEEPEVEIWLNGLEPETTAEVVDLDWVEGSDELLGELGSHDALVEAGWGESNGIAVGDRVTITGPAGDRIDAAVRGSVNDPWGLIVWRLGVPRDTLREELAVRDDAMTFVGFADDADPVATREEIDTLVAERFPNAEARSQQELRDDWSEEIMQLVFLIYVLLGLSVIISMFGVVNTLSLTIFERTREIGMLRAIGTSRSQIRRMIRYETVITALLGALVGAVIGLGLGVAAVEALRDEGLIISLAPGLPIGVLIAAALLGVLAAIIPARRASRLNVIEALQYE